MNANIIINFMLFKYNNFLEPDLTQSGARKVKFALPPPKPWLLLRDKAPP